MGYRTFTDRDGTRWEVRARTRSEWEFHPAGDQPGRPRTVASPGYEKDPFELSVEELQRLLDGSDPGPARQAKSPFKD
jgi:hypothetical protein